MADHEHPHTTTGCEEALAELYTFLDGELTADKRAAIADHLEGCNPCVEIFDFEAELRMVISKRCEEPVPETLRLRISQTLMSLSLGEPPEPDGGPGPAGRG